MKKLNMVFSSILMNDLVFKELSTNWFHPHWIAHGPPLPKSEATNSAPRPHLPSPLPKNGEKNEHVALLYWLSRCLFLDYVLFSIFSYTDISLHKHEYSFEQVISFSWVQYVWN